MAYSHYHRTGQPGWGSSEFRFGRPPTPGFQPLPTWGGHDFYRAHAANEDPYLFDHAWNRVREYGGAPGGMGVGLHEARLWHRRAYGANEINFMSPEEIGHAAAYEAYRTWIYNRSMYEPFVDDIERQREALTGLAVAEAARLLAFSSRPLDHYARLNATEAAAHTASYIFYQTRNEESRSRSRHRRSIDDPYAYDDDLLYPRSGSHSRHRSYSRHRSLSRHRGSAYGGSAYGGSAHGGSAYGGSAYGGGGSAYGGGVPAYGGGGSAYGGGGPAYGGYSPPSAAVYPPTPYPGSYAGSFAGSVSGSGIPVPMSGSVYGPSTGVPMVAGSAYGGVMVSPTPYSAPIGVPSSYTGGLTAPMDYTRSRSASFAYPQQYMQQPMQQPYVQYPQHQQYMQHPYMGTAGSAGQTIIIQKPKKHRKHRRARSSDGEYDGYSTRYSRR